MDVSDDRAGVCVRLRQSARIDVLIPKIPLVVYELYRVGHVRVTRRGPQAVPTIGVNPKLDNIPFTNRSALVVFETCEFSHLTKKKRGSPATLKVINFADL